MVLQRPTTSAGAATSPVASLPWRRRRRHLCGTLHGACRRAALFCFGGALCVAISVATNAAFCARNAPRSSGFRLAGQPAVVGGSVKPLPALAAQVGEDADPIGPSMGWEADPFLDKLRALADQGMAEAAEDALYDLIDVGKQPERAHFNAVIRACAGIKDVERAERWLFRMKTLGVVVEVDTFNSLLEVSLAAKDVQSAVAWFDELLNTGLQPDVQTFTLILRTLGVTGSTELVEVWLEKMMNMGFKPDTACCNAVIQAFAEKKNMNKVEEWIVISEKSLGVQLDVETYNVAMAGYTAMEDTQSAERLMKQLIDRGLKPNVRSYTLLTGDGKTRFSDAATVGRWSQQLRDSGFELDADTYKAVVGAWVAAGEVDKAEEWYSDMVDAGLANADALALVVDALVLSGGVEGLETAEEWVDQARRAGISPTPAVYAALASADVFRGDFEQVEARMQQMEADGLEMSEESLTSLLLAYANAEPQQNQLAEQVFKQQMLRGKLAATRDVLEALRAAVGGSRCLSLRRELQINVSPESIEFSKRFNNKRLRKWSQFETHEVREKEIVWE